MQKRRGSCQRTDHWLVSLWLMVRVLARLNGTDRPTVEISINTEAEASTGIPLRLMLVELAQRELHQQRFVTWEQVGVYTEAGVPVDAASLEENQMLYFIFSGETFLGPSPNLKPN